MMKFRDKSWKRTDRTEIPDEKYIGESLFKSLSEREKNEGKCVEARKKNKERECLL